MLNLPVSQVPYAEASLFASAEVSGPGYHKSGAWIDVDAVSATPDGSRLVIARGRVDRTFIQAPGGKPDDQMRAITDDISRRMQALDH